MAHNEALTRYMAIVQYESDYKEFTARYERMYAPLSDEERSGWRRCYVALIRADGHPSLDDRSTNPVP